MNEDMKDILEEMQFRASIYRDQEKRNEAFKDENYKCNLLLNYIQEKENIIKEVREYMKKISKEYMRNENESIIARKVLEILDKENKHED